MTCGARACGEPAIPEPDRPCGETEARAGGAWSMVRPRGRDTEIALSLTSAPRRGRAAGRLGRV
jgi:hypothetical protein